MLDAAEVNNRCTVAGGSFLESIPDGAHAYVLESIIHDWAGDSALRILRNVRTAMAHDGKQLLLEMVSRNALNSISG